MICTRWLLFAAGLLSLLPGELCSVRILLTENDISTSTAFVLGNYSIAPQERSVYLLNQCPGIKGYVGNILLTLSAAKGMSLGDYHTTAIDSTFCQALSDQLNHCGKGKKFNESEVYYHAALAIWPWNVLAVKNMGFHMELNHRVGEAMSLYSQVLAFIPTDAGLRIQEAFLCPHFLVSEAEALTWHVRMLAKAHDLLESASPPAIGATPMSDLRDIQVGAQYTGYCPGLIYEAYSRCILKSYPTLQLNNISPPPVDPIATSVNKVAIRFGVVSESVGNSSPGLCLQEIFQLIAAADWPIEFIFFTRPAMNTVFASTIAALARETYTLDEFNIEKSVQLIRDVARPDMLLYLALPTERFTLTLAHYRLAPIQMQYGLGHPLSSGILNTVDYSILSRTMLIADTDLRTAGERLGGVETDVVRTCAREASECRKLGVLESGNISVCSDVLHRTCIARGANALYYTEQVVLFEQLGFHIQDFSLLYFSSVADVLQIEDIDHCGAVAALLNRLSMGLSASDVGCGGQKPRVHLYSCIQHGKKMHPGFDRALLGIVNRDPKAVIILNQGPRDLLLARWTKNWQVSVEDILDRFIFTDRIEHPDYLRLLSYTTVFLNPFPFGSGITSSDAISVCVPIVLFPDAISVLPFALAQVRALGPMFEDLFIVHSVNEYVERAVSIAREAHTAQGHQLRRNICSAKSRLYGADSTHASAKEWAQFLVTTAKYSGLLPNT